MSGLKHFSNLGTGGGIQSISNFDNYKTGEHIIVVGLSVKFSSLDFSIITDSLPLI
jgi:hypothetical protein